MSDIHCRIEGCAGRVTLNRPQVLNALTHDMCLTLEAALLAWRDDPAVSHVVVDGAGARAFCAGGDITRLYQAGLDRDAEYGRRFWRDEYRLNALIHAYPKPYIAIMHGFVMGGGVVANFVGMRLVMRRSGPVFSDMFRLPDATAIDRNLLGGAALFGIGWGLGGLCPGPAISAMALVPGDVALFVVMMLAGLAAGRMLKSRGNAG